MSRSFKKPSVDTSVPSPDKEIDIEFLGDLNTTTWANLVQQGDGQQGSFEFNLSPLNNPSHDRTQGGKIAEKVGNMMGNMAPATLPSHPTPNPTPTPGSPPSNLVVPTPSNFNFSGFEAAPTSVSYVPSNFWSTKNSTGKKGGFSDSPDKGIPDKGIPEQPLSAKGRQLFFQHIAGPTSSSPSSRGSTPPTTSTTTSSANTRKRGTASTAQKRGGRGSSNKSIIIKLAKDAARIAHEQYVGSHLKLSEERRCKCKKSRCLKLYCECFAAHVYCTMGQCRCMDCNNLEQFETSRVAAIESALSRNPSAFTNKVTKSQKRNAMTKSTGCNCKKSLCLKKYCECFFTGMLCVGDCKCVNCENYAGSVALEGKRDAMRKEKESADLAAKVGAAAAQAVRSNGVDPEEVKRQAHLQKQQQLRAQREVQQQQQQLEMQQQYQIERQQQMQEEHRLAQNAMPELRYNDSIEPDFTYKMGNLGVKSAKKGFKPPAVSTDVDDDHMTGNVPTPTAYKSPKYKQFKEDFNVHLTDEDWSYAAEVAADILNLPDSTKSLSGKSPVHKKNRFGRSPRWGDSQQGGSTGAPPPSGIGGENEGFGGASGAKFDFGV
ncbi:hypothetical protein TL16_g00574 [Triparma laevis f. inornata]|uniref:CRC domain-containing protein n=1 Tax=Triparma laevis f. inornata TaxID=1714386 RepID=A0A9W6ZFY1_9STRA|nr:hypothetical protein TL16_g00574 [Triparma laevis f. inornata]